MMSEIIDAIIAFVGVIVSVVVSFIVSIGVNRYNYHHLFAETVSQSRNRWLNEMRDYISTMVEEAKLGCLTNKPHQTEKYLKARAEILLRLNMDEPLHALLEKAIENLDNAKQNDVDDLSKSMLEVSRLILKEEWEKVKKEAKGENNKNG